MGSDGELGLSDLDFLGDSGKLRRDALEFARTAGADLRPDQPQEASDSTGAVYLAVDDRGRVIDVGLSAHWQERLKPSDVGAALYEAYLQAAQKAQAVMAIAALHGSAHELPRSEPQPRAHESEDNDRWIDGVWEELDQIEADRRRYAEADARARAAQERRTTVTSPFGYLKVQLQGRHIVGVEADARRITEASANGLADDARAAFRAAQEADDGQ